MNHWELTYQQYPMKLIPTPADAQNIPVVFTDWFVTHDKGDQVWFTRFGNKAVWNVEPDQPWIYLQTNLPIEQDTLEASISYLDHLTDFNIYTRVAKYNGKVIAWHRPTQNWKYRNNRIVHFNQTPTEGTNSALNLEEDKSGSEEEDSEPDEDTAQVEDLLRRAETTVTSAIQKLSSRPGTPNWENSPLPKASPLPGKSQLSTAEIYQVSTPPVSKGKQPAPVPPLPRTQTSSSSSRPMQTSSISSATKFLAQLPSTRNPKGTAPPSTSSAPTTTSKACQPPGGGPPNPPPIAAPMATQNQPHILGAAPEPFDGNRDKATAF